jgi:hypothetical protein
MAAEAWGEVVAMAGKCGKALCMSKIIPRLKAVFFSFATWNLGAA